MSCCAKTPFHTVQSWNWNGIQTEFSKMCSCYFKLLLIPGRKNEETDFLLESKFNGSVKQADPEKNEIKCRIITYNGKNQNKNKIKSLRSRAWMLLYFPTCCVETITALVTVTWKLTLEQHKLTHSVQHFIQFIYTEDNHRKSNPHIKLMPGYKNKKLHRN